MRRVLLLTSAIIFVDTVFFAAVVPLLPGLSAEFGLTKGEVGFLAATYAAGTMVAAVPAGLLVTRIGPRRALVFGLVLMSGSVVGFALASSPMFLNLTRFVQGLAGAITWAGAFAWLAATASRELRGQMIGTVIAAGVAGILFGPVVGAIAEHLGRGPVFSGLAAGGLVLLILVLTSGTGASVIPPSRAMMSAAIRSGAIRSGVWIIVITGFAFGTLTVLVPLRMHELGATASGIAIAFVVASALQGIAAPLAGRLSDRRGRRMPLLLGFGGITILFPVMAAPGSSILVGLLTAFACVAIGVVNSPAMALLSDGAEHARVDLGLAFGFSNLGWGFGHAAGGILGAGVGQALGDSVAYLAIAAICGMAFALLAGRGAEPETGLA